MKKLDKSKINAICNEFSKLKKENHDILEDGIISLDKYENASIRIMWILKQMPYYEVEDYSELLETAQKNGTVKTSRTWCNIASASAGILNGQKEYAKINILSNEDLCTSLQSTSIIELVKDMGNSRTSASVALEGFAKYKDLIFRQIDAYQPDIVIVCWGESLKAVTQEIYEHFLEKSYNQKDMKNYWPVDIAKAANKTFLWTYHPAYLGVSKEKFFTSIITSLDSE